MGSRILGWFQSHLDLAWIIAAGAVLYTAMRAVERHRAGSKPNYCLIVLELLAAAFTGFVFCLGAEGMEYAKETVYMIGGLGGLMGPKGVDSLLKRVSSK